jgi:hypothetical protein
VFAGGQLVGGSDALLARIQDGSLAQLLEDAACADAQRQGHELPPQLRQAVQHAAAAAAAADADTSGAGSQRPPTGDPVLQLPPDLQQLLAAAADRDTGVASAACSSSQPEQAAFTGEALVDWIVQHQQQQQQQQHQQQGSAADAAARRAGAVAAAQQLFAANGVTLIAAQQPPPGGLVFADDRGHPYRLRRDAPRQLPWGAPLNTAYWWGPRAPHAAAAVAEGLRARILVLFEAHLAPDGRAVSYAAMKADPAFWEYVDASAELQRVREVMCVCVCARARVMPLQPCRTNHSAAPAADTLPQVSLSGLSRDALLAFGINLYNALCIHALIVHGTQRYESFCGRIAFFRKVARAHTMLAMRRCPCHGWRATVPKLRRCCAWLCVCVRVCARRLRATTLVASATRWTTWRTACCAATSQQRHPWACCSSCPASPRGPLRRRTRGART